MADVLKWVASARNDAVRDLVELGAALSPLAAAYRVKLESTADSFLLPDDEEEVNEIDPAAAGDANLTDLEASADDLLPIGGLPSVLAEFFDPESIVIDEILRPDPAPATPAAASSLSGFAPVVSRCNYVVENVLHFAHTDFVIHKSAACIELSMHCRASNSKDRLLRVQASKAALAAPPAPPAATPPATAPSIQAATAPSRKRGRRRASSTAAAISGHSAVAAQ